MTGKWKSIISLMEPRAFSLFLFFPRYLIMSTVQKEKKHKQLFEMFSYFLSWKKRVRFGAAAHIFVWH
jgi:hypothetical protein